MSNQVLTVQEARNSFCLEGVSVTDWAREHELSRQAVCAVLSRKSRCTRGRGHRIAVALGMKRSADGITAHPPGVIRDALEENESRPHAGGLRAAIVGQSAIATTAEEAP